MTTSRLATLLLLSTAIALPAQALAQQAPAEPPAAEPAPESPVEPEAPAPEQEQVDVSMPGKLLLLAVRTATSPSLRTRLFLSCRAQRLPGPVKATLLVHSAG